MDFSCPTCNVLLEAQKPEGIRLWQCPSCRGFAISLPTVRKGMNPQAFKKIWHRLSSGETETGRPCPGCRKPLRVVQADGRGGALTIDVCRTCQILWFDDKEFSDLPKDPAKAVTHAVPEAAKEKLSESRLLTPEELTFAAFEEETYRRRSFLSKLLDENMSNELGFDDFFSLFFDD